MQKVIIEVDCTDAELPQIKALLDKYTFTAEGVRQIDGYMTKTNILITPHIKKMVRAKKK